MKQPSKLASSFALVSSPGMHELAESVRIKLKTLGLTVPHLHIEYTRFGNGEVLPRIPETIRQQHVFFFHPLQYPDPNQAIIMMLLTCDALKRASANGVTLVVPYLSYMRQDRKDKPRVPISARVVFDLIEATKVVKRIITMDLHAEQEQGFFSEPLDNLTSIPLYHDFAKERFPSFKDVIILSPDFGGAVRARRFAEKLGIDVLVAIIEKRRPGPNQSEVLNIVGPSLQDKIVVMYDDMIDTGGSMLGSMKALMSMKNPPREAHVWVTHGIMSSGAEQRFADSNLSVVCTNSIPRTVEYLAANPWLTMIPIDGLLAHTIYENTIVGGSVSKLS